MANFAIIDEDEKVQHELRLYMKELAGDGVIQQFPTSEEFDKFYFNDLLHPTPKDKEFKPLSGLAPEQLEFLNSVGFAKKHPFETEKLTFDCDLDMNIKTVLPGDKPIFGDIDAPVWHKENTSLESTLPEELKVLFEKLKKVLQSKKNGEILWAIPNAEKDIWCLKADVQIRKDGFSLTLYNWQRKTLKALNRDVKLDEAPGGTPVPLDIIVFRYTNIEEKDFRLWVAKTAAYLKKLKLWPEENRPKFLALRYDEDSKEKFEFHHPFIDDLISLPLDRLITLQKLEIALNLPEKKDPSFLFVQEVDGEKVEVAKRINIERISDMGLAIRNPVELKVGTPGHFYFKFYGQEEFNNVYGKVVKNTPHREHPGEFQVFFNFFAIDKKTYAGIHGPLSRDSGFKALINPNAEEFVFNPDNIFISEDQKQKKTIVVLDPDEMTHKNMAENIRKEISNVQVYSDDSFYSFYQDHLASSAKVDIEDCVFEDLYADTVSFLFGIDDQKLQMILTPPENDEEIILGFVANEIFSEPDKWMQLFENHFAREMLMETTNILPNTKRSKRTLPLNAQDGKLKRVSVEFVMDESANGIRVNLRVPDGAMAASKPSGRNQMESLDALVIDYSLLPEDPTSFLKNIGESAKAKGIKVPSGGPKLITLVNDKMSYDLPKLLNHNIYGAIMKPVETRRLLYQLSCAADTPFTMYNFENMGFKDDHLSGRIARESQMLELSEFGISVRMPVRLKVGSMLYMFGSIFKEAPEGNLCARVYHTEEDEEEKGQYINSLIFFGINDTFLKFTRAYIRETYAAKKAEKKK